ncbi:MAG: hypothetical protein IPI81_11730 [Flavobacteriales bacterium]|nr:hypothetical protein [Flavobacteriales bacterium]
MREVHPIDDLFRQALEGASVPPPAYVGAAVLGAERARRRRAIIWRRSLVTLLLLFVISCVGVWYSSLTHSSSVADKPIENNSNESAPPVITSTGSAPAKSTPIVSNNDPGARKERSKSVESEKSGASPDRHTGDGKIKNGNGSGSLGGTALAPGAHASSVDHHRHETNTESPTGIASTHNEQVTADQFVPFYLERVRPLSAAAGGGLSYSPERVAQYDDRSASNGSWWVAPSINFYASRYVWRGGEVSLVRALNDASGWRSGLAVGLSGGRSWRSGLVLSAGVEWQRSEQAYRSVERVTDLESTAVQLVTLNIQVMSADTTWAMVESESVSEGLDRRDVFRVPVELAWHHDLRRWFAGPRIGFATEQTTVHSSAALVWDAENERVRAATLSTSDLVHRYPIAILGVLGVDLGYLAHEHWSIVASPSYLLPAFDLGRSAVTHATPERLGLRLQIRHSF